MKKSFEHYRALQLITGFWAPQIIYAAAKAGVFSELDKFSVNKEGLAKSVSVDRSRIDRLVAALIELGLLSEGESQKLVLTRMGKLFVPNSQGSLEPYLNLVGERFYMSWSFFSEMLEQEEVSAYELAWGSKIYTENNAEIENHFYNAMNSFSSQVTQNLSDILISDNVHSILDIGGGRGDVVLPLLAKNSALKATVLDRESVESEFNSNTQTTNALDFVCGNFLENLPIGFDSHLLFRVIHNLSDKQCQDLFALSNTTLNPSGVLYIIDSIQHAKPFSALMDLNMMVLTGGMLRSTDRIVSICSDAGFEFIETKALDDVYSVLKFQVLPKLEF